MYLCSLHLSRFLHICAYYFVIEPCSCVPLALKKLSALWKTRPPLEVALTGKKCLSSYSSLSHCIVSPKLLHSKSQQPQGHSSFHLAALLTMLYWFPSPSSLIFQDGGHKDTEVTCRHNRLQYKKDWAFLCLFLRPIFQKSSPSVQVWARKSWWLHRI